MNVTIPSLEWYTSFSKRKGGSPRCPFASVDRCPRFYQSLSLLGSVGCTTPIEPDEDQRLLESWKKTELWPVTDEQATSTFGPNDEPKHFSNFCPEVSFDRFGLFASQLHRYADEIDVDVAHATLGKMGAGSQDWRWHWMDVSPLHYSECPLYSCLMHDTSKLSDVSPDANNSKEKILDLRPSYHGITLNIGALMK